MYGNEKLEKIWIAKIFTEKEAEIALDYMRMKPLSYYSCFIALMKQNGMDKIMTFDEGFKKIKGIKVVF